VAQPEEALVVENKDLGIQEYQRRQMMMLVGGYMTKIFRFYFPLIN
jgi:hypothetical protein